jgi:acyl carrier protein
VEQVDPKADIFEVYGVNSVRAVKLLSTLEVELDIEFPEEEMQDIRTLEDVRALAQRLLAEDAQMAAEG